MSLSRAALRDALAAAAEAHHEYQERFLGGARDAQWSGFYAAYALGRLGDFASPAALSRWLADTSAVDDWVEAAAERVLDKLP